jgi:hypothetical protein
MSQNLFVFRHRVPVPGYCALADIITCEFGTVQFNGLSYHIRLFTFTHIFIHFTPFCLDRLLCSFAEWKVKRFHLLVFHFCGQSYRSPINLDIMQNPAKPVGVSSGFDPSNLWW